LLTHRRKQLVEWGDCDPAGIVFFPRYLAWIDASTAHLFAAAGLPWPSMIRDYGMIGLPLVDVHAKFSSPSRFGDELDAECEIAEWRRSSFRVAHRLYNRGILAVEAAETRVWALPHPEDPARIKAGPIPAEVIERFK
jgi:4-hydroxybenzoyl-CoA thioesterase